MPFGPIHSLGRLQITAGTPLRVTNNEPTPTDRYQCHAIMIEAWPTNAGKVWIFDREAGNKTTGEGVVAILAPPATNIFPTFTVGFSGFANPIDASLYWVDVDNTGEGVVISALVL